MHASSNSLTAFQVYLFMVSAVQSACDLLTSHIQQLESNAVHHSFARESTSTVLQLFDRECEPVLVLAGLTWAGCQCLMLIEVCVHRKTVRQKMQVIRRILEQMAMQMRACCATWGAACCAATPALPHTTCAALERMPSLYPPASGCALNAPLAGAVGHHFYPC